MQPIAIIHTESSLDWGERQSQILEEMLSLKERGYQVGLIAPLDSEILKRARDFGLDAFGENIAGFGMAGFRAAVAWLRRFRCDVVHCHGDVDHRLFVLAKIWVRKKIKIVRTRHEVLRLSRDPFTHACYTWLTHRCVVASEFMRAEMVRRNRIPVSKISVIPPSVDITKFNSGNQLRAREALQLPMKAFLIGTASQGEYPEKELDHVLTALAQFPDEVILTVWCKSGDVIRFVQGVKSGPLSHRVRVFGEKDSEEAFFQSLDLFVQVFEEKEAIPVDFLKAMACEVPVIAARVRGVSGLIAEGETGLLFESGHSRELEIMIRKILSDSVLYRQIASQGANYVRQALDPEIRLDVLESMYHDLVE